VGACELSSAFVVMVLVVVAMVVPESELYAGGGIQVAQVVGYYVRIYLLPKLFCECI